MWRRTYRKLRGRAGKTSPGRWLKQVLKTHARRAQKRPRIQDESAVFIVAEKDAPYPDGPYMYEEWLVWVAENDPKLHSRIHLSKLPAEVPTNTAVFHAWVQDPVRERDEALFVQLEEMERRARRGGARVIHPARVLSNSRRDAQFERLGRAGLRTPRIVDVDADFGATLGGLTLPIVVRKSWGHCDPLALLSSQDEVAMWLTEQGPSPHGWVAAEYIDVRSSDGYYRKYRYVLIGDRGVCRHLLVSSRWEVRPGDRVLTDETIAEELRFVGSPCDVHEALNRARSELEFDIAAFDYSFDSNGQMIVWEVNPYPDLSTPRGRPGEYLGESMLRTNQALAALYRDGLAAAHPNRSATRSNWFRASDTREHPAA